MRRWAGDLAHSNPHVVSRSTWFTSALHLPKLKRPWRAQGAWQCWLPFFRYQLWTSPTPCFFTGSVYFVPKDSIQHTHPGTWLSS